MDVAETFRKKRRRVIICKPYSKLPWIRLLNSVRGSLFSRCKLITVTGQVRDQKSINVLKCELASDLN
jgi:hypothetical protein